MKIEVEKSPKESLLYDKYPCYRALFVGERLQVTMQFQLICGFHVSL